MTENKSNDRDPSEKYERVVSELLEQISERNKRIANLNLQIQEGEQHEKNINAQLARLSEQINDLKQQLSEAIELNRQLSEGNKIQRMARQFRRRLPGTKNR